MAQAKNMMIGQMPVFTDEEGGIYVADATGLYHIGRNGTLWEQLIDGSLNSMGRQDMYLMKFFRGRTMILRHLFDLKFQDEAYSLLL